MDTLVISIDWPYFLGMLGSLIAIAYFANGRFTALETTTGWLKEMVTELLLDSENRRTRVYEANSPISLTPTGYQLLQRSGLKSYIESREGTLLSRLGAKAKHDPYELQRRAFRLFDELPFEEIVSRHLNRFAFENGVSTGLLRRVGAIYLRDLAARSL